MATINGTTPLYDADAYRKQRNNLQHQLNKVKKEHSHVLLKLKANDQRRLEMEKLRRNRNRRDLAMAKHTHASPQLGENLFAIPGDVRKLCTAAINSFGGVDETLGTVRGIAPDLKSLCGSAENTASNIDLLVDTACGVLNGATDMITSLAKWLQLPSDICITSLMASVVQFIRAFLSSDRLGLFLGGTALCAQLGITWPSVVSVLASWKEWYQQYRSSTKQDTSRLTPQFSITDLITTDYQWLLGCVLCVASMMLRGNTVDYTTIQRNLADFGRASIGFTNLEKLVDWIIRFIKNQYYMITTGKTFDQTQLEQAYPEMEKVLVLVELIKNLDTTLLDQDVKLCKIVIATFQRLNDYRVQALKGGDRKLAAIFQQHAGSLVKFNDLATRSPAHCVSSRSLPMATYLYGSPGVGKSVLCTWLESKIYAEYLSKDGWSASDYVFTRNSDNDFWDGYHHQPIIKYDDILQQTDSQTKPNNEIMEIVRIVNESAYHLHMAELVDKKNVYMDSQFVVASSNIKRADLKSIKDPNSFYRRWHLAADVGIAPQFSKQTVIPGGRTLDVIDPVKVAAYCTRNNLPDGSFIPEVYSLTTYDPLTGSVLNAGLTLDTFWDVFKTKRAEIQVRTSTLRDSILKQAGVVAPNHGNNLLETRKAFEAVGLIAQSSDDVPCDYSEIESDDYSVEDFWDEESVSEYSDYVAGILVDTSSSQESSVTDDDTSSEYSCQDEFDDSLDADTPVAPPLEPGVVPSSWDSRYWYDAEHSYDQILFSLEDDENVLSLASLRKERIQLTKEGVTSFVKRQCARLRLAWKKSLSLVPTVVSDCGQRLMNIVKFFDGTIDAGLKALGVEKGWHMLVAALGALLSGWWLSSQPSKTPCVFEAVRTFEQLQSLEQCNNNCSFCDLHFKPECILTSAPVGSIDHGIGLLRYLARNTTDRKWVNMYLAVSKSAHRISAESREIVTRARPAPVIRESNTTKTLAHPVTRVAEAKMAHYRDGQLVAQVSDTVQLEQWESVCSRNMARITAYTDKCFDMNLVFVSGRTAILPNHFVVRCKPSTRLAIRNPYCGMDVNFEFSECVVSQCTALKAFIGDDQTTKNVDCSLITFPARIASRRSILKNFAPAQQLAALSEGTILFGGLRNIAYSTSMVTFHAKSFKVDREPISYIDTNHPSAYAHQSLWYDVDTKAGDCGGLVFCKNRLIAGKIVGMHVAGKDGAGVAIMISREFLERNLHDHVVNHKLDVRSIVDAGVPYAMENEMTAEVATNLVDTSKIPSNSLAWEGDCISLGTAKAPSASSLTQLRPSLIYRKIYDNTTRPAALRPMKIGSLLVDPLRQGIKKVLGCQVNIDPVLLDIARNDVSYVLASDDDRRVLTFEEAVTGLPEMGEFYKPINRSTSPGYPWCLDNPGTGKQHWLGSDDYIFDSELKQVTADLIAGCKEGKRGDVVFTASLKDERRTHAKVDQVKTRVFEAAPMHYVIAVRQYFLSFINSVMTHRIDNEVAVGTNVYDMDWEKIASRLETKGPHNVGGDFGNYDGSLTQELLWTCLEIINDWYGKDQVEANKVRTVLWEELCNSRVLVGDELIQQTHSQPSGNPLTVIINSMCNQLLMRCAYLDCKRLQGLGVNCDFSDKVALVVYGDDNCLNISPSVIEWFNQHKISEALGRVGMTYTDESKSGVAPEYRPLSEISFLKRSFRQGTNGWRIAPLELSVIREMSNWTRGKWTRASTIENVETAIREFALHGRLLYNDEINLLKKACTDVGLKVRFPTFEESISALNES